MSRRQRNRQNTVAAIRAAALRLFSEKGYSATRTREIAAEAGIATGTLFNYAPTKEAVVLLVWKGLASDALAEGLAAAHQADDPVDAMVALFTPIFRFYGRDPELGRIFLSEVVYADPSDPELVALNEGFIAQISALLAPHAGAGALSAAMNVFASYYTVLTMLLAGRLLDVASASHLFRDLVRTQQQGWSTPG